jgi:hypothetical protein
VHDREEPPPLRFYKLTHSKRKLRRASVPKGSGNPLREVASFLIGHEEYADDVEYERK